ncbi:hypothetical protein pb186bvf_007618 [Paramecium bursaria]
MQLINEAICSDDYSAIRCDCRGAYKPTAITILLNFIVTNKSDSLNGLGQDEDCYSQFNSYYLLNNSLFYLVH